ncbi:MAG: putative DNA binding domain-containing protein [Eubacteriales bacterium]|nr:putative DNA binding domain-containing protein [Eubacteriales bacterium]
MNLGTETEQIEFKKSTSELKEGLVSLSSMLNKNAYGVLYFGIKNDGDVIGQQIGDRTLREISQAIANNIKPQVIPTIELKLLDDKNVIRIEVRGNDFPYSAFGRYYMRSADEDRELSPSALKKLLSRSVSSDVLTHLDSPVQGLTFNKLKMYFTNAGLTVNPFTFETNMGLKNETGKYNLMAYLLADVNDVSIKVVTFAGKDKTSLVSRNEYGGTCLIQSMEMVTNYVASINTTRVTMTNNQRIEEKLFDMASFKEAWQNACIHTRWDKGNPPAVYIFSDRIEIISTGGLPSDLTKDEFYKGISRPINFKLQKIFAQLGYVEQTGHGIPLIISNYGKQAFDIMDNYINVTIPFTKEDNQETADAKESLLKPAEKKVAVALRDNPTAKVSDLEDITDFSRSYISSILRSLKEQGILQRKGSKKNGVWVLLNVPQDSNQSK